MKTRMILLLGAIALASCRDTALDTTPNVTTTQNASAASLSKQFACLPKEAAFIAAHRGTVEGTEFPENALSSLKALIDKGFLFAEIDVAKIKDGTHILYHDGVWDEKSTGKGAIAATSRERFDAILLRDTNGDFSSERPPTLADILAAAKNKIYLEIDFKSSADYKTVIDAIRDAGMADQVILIAYNSGQAAKMASLAPEMMLSVSAKSESDLADLENNGVKPSNMAVWQGNSPLGSGFSKTLRTKNLPELRFIPQSGAETAAKQASLLVTDQAFDYEPIVGLTPATQKRYTACLIN